MNNMLLAKLMEKKKNQAPMDENEKNARVSMLQALKNEMHGMMADDMKKGGTPDAPGVKKVEVAADNKGDLAAGLDKAKDMLGSDADPDEDAEGGDAADADMPAEGDEGGDDMDKGGMADAMGLPSDAGKAAPTLNPQEIDTLIALLTKMKSSQMGGLS